MSKILNIAIKDKYTLVLKQDAQAGDEIDLLSLNELDLQNIEKQIEAGVDKVYNQKITALKTQLAKEHELELENATLKAIKELDAENKDLKSKLENLEENLKNKYERVALEKNTELLQQISELKNTLDLERQQAILNQEKIIFDKNNEYKELINQLEDEKRRLMLEKSSLNVKQIGERLEHWCENEYNNQAINGFFNCTFEKDNKSIKEEDETKGTKADYIFKVYSDNRFLETELLTSVVCEMKSEDPTSKIKHKNADHYKKLDTDRKKKNCEYALLVSELEWNDTNDVPIRKVREYEKMYVVRPQYFVTFLNLITSLAVKYQELILEKEKEEKTFKETEDILLEFEEMKNVLLDKPIKKIEKEIEEINRQRQVISDAATKIALSTSKLADTLIDDIKKKIENFNIKKLTKKIAKIEN